MNADKISFLQNEFIPLIKKSGGNANGKWGVMNAQQMVEHITGFFKISTEKLKFPLVTPAEQLPAYMAFLLSEKQFRENTKAPESIVGKEPLPVYHASMEAAVDKLGKETKYFFEYFKENPSKKTLHPVFGYLGYAEWVQLHHKHVVHHLRQFGLVV